MSVISVSHLTKRYGPVLAVDDLSFDVHPGKVTGFLGPNGAGKTTTLRILLGLAAAGAGLPILELSRHDEDLEALFFDLVNARQEVAA